MTKYEKVILDYEIPLTSHEIRYFFDQYNGVWLIAFSANSDEEISDRNNWVYEYESDELHVIQHVFYVKDLTQPDQKIDYGDIEIEKGFPGNTITVHLKIVSHDPQLDNWWKIFRDEIFRKSKDVFPTFIPPSLFFEHTSDEKLETDQSLKNAPYSQEMIEEIQSTSGLSEGAQQPDSEELGLLNSPIYIPKSSENYFPKISLKNDAVTSGTIKRYGTDRNISANQISSFIRRCRLYQESTGSIKRFYYEELTEYHTKFTFETFRKWLYDPRFIPK